MRVKLHNTWPRTGTSTGTMTERKDIRVTFRKKRLSYLELRYAILSLR